MTNRSTLIFLVLFSLFLVQCGSDSDPGLFTAVNHVAVDATNDRFFLTEPEQKLFVFTASTQENLASQQPLVDEDTNEDIAALLPRQVSQLAVYAEGTTSRLFILGGVTSPEGTELNEIRVLDFDGDDFTETDFSPITLSDGDADTDDSDNAFADLLVDGDNGVVYVTDATAGLLYVLSAVDGTTVSGPYAIAGIPQGLALDNARLYVCNSSVVDAEQVVTVFNTADYTTTAIDLDIPCHQLAVQSNEVGTVMLVRQYDDEVVLIHSVDTTTYALSTPLVAETDDYVDGFLTNGHGISSSINGLVLVRDGSDQLHAYLSELDGNVQHVTVSDDLTAYEAETLSTSAANLTDSAALSSGDGEDSLAFIVSESGALLVVDVETSDIEVMD
ncbi:MAG: hypothetical protein ACD_62C00296G0003 [uncultured bacterium]|nr:MAG: hypothetical protein ACD_62C00296G0003 [uncultured bacterium]